jgi:hypothetical protein
MMRRTVVAALPLVAGVALAAFGPGVPVPAAAGPGAVHVDRNLGYRCGFPSGEQPVDVRLTADIPETGTVGVPVQPRAAGVTVSIAQPALADLTALGATAAGAVVRLGTTITQGDSGPTRCRCRPGRIRCWRWTSRSRRRLRWSQPRPGRSSSPPVR